MRLLASTLLLLCTAAVCIAQAPGQPSCEEQLTDLRLTLEYVRATRQGLEEHAARVTGRYEYQLRDLAKQLAEAKAALAAREKKEE